MPTLLLGMLIGGLVLVAFVWLCLVVPFTSEVLVRIGERYYRDLAGYGSGRGPCERLTSRRSPGR